MHEVLAVSNRQSQILLCEKYRGGGGEGRGERGEGAGERYEPSTVTGKVRSEEPPWLLAVMCTA